ncbi:MAG: DNA-protecting protein DprA [Clostridia bacterium]|nr:DNA-protecting protein DprA [Clostridia bacterium]
MSYTKSEIDLIIVDSINLLYYQYKKLLLASINANAADRQKYETELIKSVGEGVYNKVKALFADEKYREEVLADLKRRGIECVTFVSADYPEQLKHVDCPPIVLYLRGRRELLSTRMFAVVGSRRTPANIAEETKRLCAELSKFVTIVTGVADGGDSAAITGALTTGNVICVLPGGHDANCCNNVNLYKRVEREGLALTEFTPTVPVQRFTFRMRNRIIAGLAEGLLVVSAGEKSGTSSTVEFATAYNKDVFAFPYS